MAAGAEGELIEEVATRLVSEGRIRLNRAKEVLEELSHQVSRANTGMRST
jgi:polyhydroxyalkanoate synthesis regulator phasin